MASVRFTANIQRHVACPDAEAAGATVREVLDRVFTAVVDSGGDRLAFGSTTGGLWVSENQGDDWAMVTHTLPPVYAVRFV